MNKLNPTAPAIAIALVVVPLPDMGVDVTLRPAKLPDVYRAMDLVELPAGAEGGMTFAQRLAYQQRVDDMQALCQITALDGGEPPANLPALADELSPDDMAAIRTAVAEIKKKPKPASNSAPPGELLSAPSSNADGAPQTLPTPS